MPVSTDHRQSKRCKNCEEGSHGDSVYWNIQLDQDLLNTIISIYPEWFKGLKPTVECNMAQGGSSAGTSTASVGGGSSQTVLYPRSPPKAEVDDSPLQKSMDRNKESLKVKLMLRRPINQLVAQGIMPQLKTSPTIHEQKQKLERAKMGDLLKAKIQQRPDRQELVRQHILEADVGHVDPSLAERQRMLKKCRLVDSLNDQLSHRPGPLELIKKNILHTEEPIERAVKEGFIEFKATSEGQKVKPEPPDHYMTIDDDSQSSDAQSPKDCNSVYNVEMSPPSAPPQAMITDAPVADVLRHATGADMLETAAAQAGIVTVVVAQNAGILATAPSPLSLGSSTSSLSPLSSIASPSSTASHTSGAAAFACSSPALAAATARPSLPIHQQQPAPGKDKNRKKSKSKTQQQKTRTIKFHEYKGPPNAQKNSTYNSSNSSSNAETSYELLLQQQQLYLQWELEVKQRCSQMLLPTPKPMDQSPSSPSVISLPSPSPSVCSQRGLNESSMSSSASPPPSNPPPPPPLPPPPPPPLPSATSVGSNSAKPLRNLEDMKVSDLKAELKKRNLRVSGPKPHLIQRLKPYAENATSISSNFCNQSNAPPSSNVAIPCNDDSIPDSSVPSPMPQINQSPICIDITDSNSKPSSPHNPTTDMSVNKVSSSGEMNNNELSEDIIREKERQIKELQRQLLNSQLLLQQQRQQQLQQQARSSQTFQPTPAINAKANLAAFLHQQQLNQLLAQKQRQQQQQQQQLQQQQQQQIHLTVMNGNHLNRTTNNNNNEQITATSKANRISLVNNNAANNSIIRNINNNIVIKNSANGSNNCNNGVRQKGTNNTVIFGEYPAALVFNHVNKSDGQHQRTTSLPNFVGTFVQPQFVLSSQGMKQLVFDSDSLILPEQIKVENGFINGSIVAAAENGVTSSTGLLQDEKPTIANDGTSQIIVDNDNFVTLHIGEDENMVVNDYEPFHQNEDISKLFKQEHPAAESVDDVLQLLMKNGEFHPPEADHQCADMNAQYAAGGPQPIPTTAASGATFVATVSSTAPAQFGSTASPAVSGVVAAAAPPATASANSAGAANGGNAGIYASSHIDPGVPSQHLSLEELGIDMEAFPMDLCEQQLEPVTAVGSQPSAAAAVAEFMDVDGDWLERLISDELDHSAASSSSNSGNYESLHCGGASAPSSNNVISGGDNNITDSLDFFNIDDNDLKIAAELSWDRVDFAT